MQAVFIAMIGDTRYVLKNVYYKISYNNKCFVKYDYGI